VRISVRLRVSKFRSLSLLKERSTQRSASAFGFGLSKPRFQINQINSSPLH